MDGWMDDYKMDRWMAYIVWIEKWMDIRWTDEYMDEWMTIRWIDECMDEGMTIRCIDECMDD